MLCSWTFFFSEHHERSTFWFRPLDIAFGLVLRVHIDFAARRRVKTVIVENVRCYRYRTTSDCLRPYHRDSSWLFQTGEGFCLCPSWLPSE